VTSTTSGNAKPTVSKQNSSLTLPNLPPPHRALTHNSPRNPEHPHHQN
jgi:hypothetical protein